MVIDCNRKHFLGLVLADYIVVQEGLELLWGSIQLRIECALFLAVLVVMGILEDACTDVYAVLADKACHTGNQVSHQLF